MNKEMMYRVADAIEAETMTFEMDVFGAKNSCGTYACVAGHAVSLMAPEEFKKSLAYAHPERINDRVVWIADSFGKIRLDVSGIAADGLGLTESESDRLFYGKNAFPKLSNAQAREKITRNRALVPDALRWMADNDVIDWNRGFLHACEIREKRDDALLESV